MNGQLRVLDTLFLGEKFPTAHWVRDWVGLRAGLDAVAGCLLSWASNSNCVAHNRLFQWLTQIVNLQNFTKIVFD